MKKGALLIAVGLLSFTTATFANEPQTRVSTIESDSIYESVCHLKVWRNGRAMPSKSSAVLFENRYLLTAAHNVLQARRSISKIEVRCGVSDAESVPAQQTLEGWRSQRASKFTFLRGFPSRRDFGVILLEQPIETALPVRLSTSALRMPDRDTEEQGEKVCLYGFPGDTFSNAYRLFEACQPVTGPSFFKESVRYRIQTYTGNSGGPVIRHTPSGPELVAIHVQPSSGRLANERFERDVRKIIRKLERREAERAAED